MYECEIKLFEIDKNAIVQQLNRIWAKDWGSTFIVDVYLKADNPKTVRWRVRYTPSKTVLTYKWKLQAWTMKHAYEFDTKLPNEFFLEDSSRKSLVDHCRVKKRTTYTWWWYQFDIDEYIWLPPILEIEWPNEASIIKLITSLWWQWYPKDSCWWKWVYAYFNCTYPDITSWFVWRLLSLIRCW